MSIKLILIAAALILSPQLYAGTLHKLIKEPLTINQCPISETNNPLDLALINKGFFVVSSGKKNSELLFTRYGKLYLDADNYMRTDEGDYLLAVTKKSDSKNLHKIKFSFKNLAPKATSKINIGMNLPASAPDESNYQVTQTINDGLGKQHSVELQLAKIATSSWKAKVFVDDVERDEGTLVFNTSGNLAKQEGLRHIHWPDDYGMYDLKIDCKTSTQFASPFSINFVQRDGNPMGVYVGLNVTRHGEISLMYDNGISKLLKNRIAIAMFTNPGYLEHVTKRLYRATERSGQPMIHWVNGEYAVLSGALEEEACIKN